MRANSAVARALGLRRAGDRQAAFVRAVQSRPEAERAALSKSESLGLDQLENRTRSRDAVDSVKLERGLTPSRPSAKRWREAPRNRVLTSAGGWSSTAASGLTKCVALTTNSGWGADKGRGTNPA